MHFSFFHTTTPIISFTKNVPFDQISYYSYIFYSYCTASSINTQSNLRIQNFDKNWNHPPLNVSKFYHLCTFRSYKSPPICSAVPVYFGLPVTWAICLPCNILNYFMFICYLFLFPLETKKARKHNCLQTSLYLPE